MLEIKFISGRYALVEVDEIHLNDGNGIYTGEIEWRETILEYGSYNELNEKVINSQIIERW